MEASDAVIWATTFLLAVVIGRRDVWNLGVPPRRQ